MAGLNLCSGCGKNFAGLRAFDTHRTGEYADRRCKAADELQAKGWTMAVEPVTRRREGIPYIEQMETWAMPLSESAKAYFASLKAGQSTEDEESEE